MSAAIERLRASKAESLKRDELEGRTHGRAWAEHHADYTDLRRLSELKLETIDHDAFEALVHALDPEGETGLKDLKEHCFGEPDADVSDAYIAAFIEGAVEFFKEVADKL